MTASASLQSIAREKNWMEFAVRLEAAMAQPESFGLADAAAVRAAVGRMRRQLPSTLTIALSAMRYLRENHATVLAARDARIGCAPVRLLARIDTLSPSSAAALAPRIFAGSIRPAELRARYDILRQAAQRRAGTRPAAAPRGRPAARSPNPQFALG